MFPAMKISSSKLFPSQRYFTKSSEFPIKKSPDWNQTNKRRKISIIVILITAIKIKIYSNRDVEQNALIELVLKYRTHKTLLWEISTLLAGKHLFAAHHRERTKISKRTESKMKIFIFKIKQKINLFKCEVKNHIILLIYQHIQN